MAYLDEQAQSTNEDNQNNTYEIEHIIRNFDGQRNTSNVSPLGYWDEQKLQMPSLYYLSQAIFAIPPTQTSVERSFSSLPIVLTSHRTRLSDDCLQNILLIKNNQNVF